MLSKIPFLAVAAFWMLFIQASTAKADGPSTQMIVVTTPGWDTVSGILRRFERSDTNAAWHPTGSSWPIVVGRSGLGWGRGLHPTNALSGPIKKEGDGRSPAGIFTLSSAFGIKPPQDVAFVKLPYRQLTAPIECVDDLQSAYYNQIVDREQVGKVDWNSSEKMREIGEQYRLGVFVDHNNNPPHPGSGSCIFLHIWKSARLGTSGCTAMTGENIEDLLRWLDPAKTPLLVQMPDADYKKLRTQWHLPALE